MTSKCFELQNKCLAIKTKEIKNIDYYFFLKETKEIFDLASHQ